MRTKGRLSRGFSLVELMIVVAVIGVIASIAIPGYQKLTARSHRSEMLSTLSKVRMYFKNLHDGTGSFSTTGSPATSDVNPDPTLAGVGQPAPWNPKRAGWTELPFSMEGSMRMRYWYELGPADGANQVHDMVLHACGSFPAFGPTNITCTTGVTGNYFYTETFHGNGSSDPAIEVPNAF
jgi:prepilin-type N-terminal cleavage/methylation domain-containing protein